EGLLVGIGNPLLDISAIVDEELLNKYGLKPDDAIMAEETHMPLYRELMDNSEGVTVRYQVNESHPTGTCAVLLTGTHRSLCANLAAAQNFTPDYLATEESRKSIEAAKYFYASGFFVAVSPDAIMQLAKHSHAKGLSFVMNLSAPFIALQIAAMPKLSDKRQRAVVITQGCQPVILVENGEVTLIPVTALTRDQIVDTNGAGDAFAGGFLAQMVLGSSYVTAVKCGIYTATHIIQASGCTVSGVSDFKS
ncbi:Adenosine kinase, partial [Operophtera brumata]